MQKIAFSRFLIIFILGAGVFAIAPEETARIFSGGDDSRNENFFEKEYSLDNLELAGTLGEEGVLRIPLPPLPEIPDEPRAAFFREAEITDEPQVKASFQGNVFSRELIGAGGASGEKVEDPASQCGGSFFEQLRCYGNYLARMVEESGVEAAMVDVKERYNSGNSFVHAQCHQLTHIIGRRAAGLYPTVGEAYNHGDGFCWSGYYHGIMEAVLAQMGEEGVRQNLDSICADLPGKATYSFNYYNCVHGLGHGVMFIENHELFDALKTCGTLSGHWEEESCASGALMENIIANEVDHFTKYLKDDDPFYPCNAVKEKYKRVCYLMQTSRMLDMYNQNFEKVFDVCGQAEEKYRETCYQSLGRDASGRSVSDIERTRISCLLGPNEDARKNCVIGAVKDFISYHHSDKEARALCSRFGDDSPVLGEVCHTTAEIYYQSFSR